MHPQMMDAQAQSCPVSTDGFHWVGSTPPVCRACGASCAPLPNYEVDPAVINEIDAERAARARAFVPPVPCRERWGG